MKAFIHCIWIISALSACAQSDEASESFGLPVIDITMASEQLGQLNASYNDKSTFSARVKVDGKHRDARVNYAGRTTLDAWKKSWDIAFKDDPSAGIFGRIWRISATPDDPTFLRSLAGYRLFQAAGFHVPHLQPVVLYLNGEYQGLFLQKELVDEHFFERRSLSLRCLYKAQYNDKNLDERSITLTSDFFAAKYHAHQPPGGEKNWSDLRTLLRQIIAATADRPKYLDTIDHDSLYRYHAVTVALNNWDGFSNNFFLYKNAGDNTFHFQPWDLDRAFESETETFGLVGDDVWGRYIAANPERQSAYLEHLREVLALLADPAFIKAISMDAEKVAAAWKADRMLRAKSVSFEGAVEALKVKITDHVAYLRGLIELI